MKIELKDNKVFFENQGLKKEIHPFWLRERVNDDNHVDKITQQRLFDPSELKNIEVDKMSLSNDFLVNILDMKYEWKKVSDNLYDGYNRDTGEKVYTATRVDLVFGSNSQLRAISEVYAYEDANDTFVNDFISAWRKVMNSDRFDV